MAVLEERESPQQAARQPAHHPAPRVRLMSVDALRGADMFWIMGGREAVLAFVALFVHPFPEWFRYQFSHPEWVGRTFWDLIMPTFLFIVGTSMPLAFAKRIEEGQSRTRLHLKIVQRTLLLIVLGMIASGNLLAYDLSKIRLGTDTLEAIACGYLVAGIVMLNLPIAGQAITIGVLLVAYWALMVFVPVPGYGPGVIEPNANVALAVDQFIMGKFDDPEPYTGILSAMGYGATVLIGVMAGHLLRSGVRPLGKIAALFLASIACLFGGWAWAVYLGFPIIKHCWSSSYVLWSAGWSLLALTVFYTIIDVVGWRRWAFPFVVIGMNAITAYLAYKVFHRQLIGIANTLVGGLAQQLGPFGSFLLALTTFLLLWFLLLHLYRHKIFLRV